MKKEKRKSKISRKQRWVGRTIRGMRKRARKGYKGANRRIGSCRGEQGKGDKLARE